MIKEKGLTQKEAKEKLVKYGPNEIKDVSKTTPQKILWRQIRSNFLIYLLTIATIISFSVGKSTTAYAILTVILAVIIFGFVQEYRAEKSISALKGMLVPVSIVIREGKEQEVKSSEIVPEDIVIIRNGERVPADCLLLAEKKLRVDESMLTGESIAVQKKIISGKSYSDENIVFMGTHVVNGRCAAKVMHTGMNTKFGKIAKMITTTEKTLPLQQKVNKIVKQMVIFAIMICIITGALILSRSTVIDKGLLINTLILMIALAVSSFPESFPLVLITTLASGAQHMAKQNAIVNRMSIIETLGETTIICSDKTGTITKGEMTVRKIFADNQEFEITGTGYDAEGEFLLDGKKISTEKHPTINMLLKNAVLCNDAIIERAGTDKEYKTIGSPTEAALMILAAKAAVFREDINHIRAEELPFSSERKMMSVLSKSGEKKYVFSKGAAEYLIEKCNFLMLHGKKVKLTAGHKKKIMAFNRKMTTQALRTIALAYKEVNTFSKDHFEDSMVFLGLAGMEDPPREGVKESIDVCREAGIKVKMITGDHRETAIAIAKEVGLEGKVIGGFEIENTTDEELAKKIGSITIFARVKPEHKLRIIKALKANGEIVTMTGDGVNDAPALKEAHIGIAMGKKGTDVSRSVADLTLKDDNFKTIVSAVKEGRTIFSNVRKFGTYQLSCSIAELLILLFGVILAPFLGWQIPLLLALQILFMNLVTADIPAVALGLNKSSTDAMVEPPRKNSSIINKKMFFVLAFTGLLLTILVLFSYYTAFNIMRYSHEHARTVALSALIGLEIVAAFNFRSFRKGTLTRSIMVNPYLVYASLVSLAATFVIIYTPANRIFETIPLGIKGALIVLAVSIIFLIIMDLLKFINKKWEFLDLNHA